jgi:hypothetical protein
MNTRQFRTIGALAGLAAGTLLTPQSVLGLRSTAIVAWDGSACPAGSYSLITTATSRQTGDSFQTPPVSLALPASVVEQDLSDLPDGTYDVIANVAGAGGRSFHSFPLAVTVGTGLPPQPIVPAPSPTPVPPAPPVPAPIVTPDPAPGSRPGVQPPPTPPPANVGPDGSPLQGNIPLVQALNMLALFPTDINGVGITGISVTALDVDHNGTIDFIRIAVAGTVMTWRVLG